MAGKLLALFGGDATLCVEISLVADDSDDGGRVGVIAKLLEPAFKK